MHTYDPLQTQLTMGAYSGATNPFGSPYTAFQPAINPASFNPFAGPAQTGAISPFGQQGYPGIPNYGAIAQQQQLQQLQQLALLLASQGGIPQAFGMSPHGWQNPQVMQNPQFGQNPLFAQNPLLNPVLAQQLALQAVSQYMQPQYGQPQYGQGGPGYPQFGQPGALPYSQQGYPLAPQSWVGQAGIHPHHLAHLAARGIY
jgi:hypothetical protein